MQVEKHAGRTEARIGIPETAGGFLNHTLQGSDDAVINNNNNDNILQLFEKYGILNKVKEVDENGRQQ
jgi:hypothetical protein